MLFKSKGISRATAPDHTKGRIFDNNGQPLTTQTETLTQKLIFTRATDIEHVNMSRHRHPSHHQLIYMIKGTLYIKMDEEEYFLPEGFIGILPAGMAHSLFTRNVKVKMFLIYFPSECTIQEFFSLNSNDFIIENLRYISKQPAVLDLAKEPDMYRFVMGFLGLLKEDARTSFPMKGLIAPKNERLAPVLQYLLDHHITDVTLDKVAQELGFTVRNLTRLFKRENLSFNNCLNYIRIIHAMELFAEGQDHIERVAYAVGYHSISNFSRTFKKYTGHTPSDFLRYNNTRAIIRTKVHTSPKNPVKKNPASAHPHEKARRGVYLEK